MQAFGQVYGYIVEGIQFSPISYIALPMIEQ